MTAYGYRIVQGEALLHEEKSKQIKELFASYLKGDSIRDAAKEAGIPYTIAQRALSNPTYLGTDFYPPIIDKEIFARAQERRARQNRQKSSEKETNENRKNPSTGFGLGARTFSEKVPEDEEAASWVYRHIIRGKEIRMSERLRKKLLDYVLRG
ncbi:MAG: recombinase [Eubacterium sp.]|nr:recombinase [Eubacterium sp.]